MAISRPPTEIVDEIKYFKGLKISVNNTQIDKENSPDMLNLMFDDRGTLNKRPGKINLFVNLNGAATTLLSTYKKSTGDIHVFIHGTKFYKILDLTAGTYELEYDGISGTRIRGITYNDLFYFWDGTSQFQYDGATVSIVVGKIPTITIATPPAGGGTLFEPINFISGGYTQSFSGDNLATVYQLALLNLDDTTVTATVDGVTKVEGVDFTVNRTLGTVTWLVAPPNTQPDNVPITFYKQQYNVQEIASLTVTAGATASSNVTVTLNAVPTLVAVVNGDTAAQVATKIRAAAFTGWTTGGTGTTVTFTATTYGNKGDISYSAGTTGATSTVSVTRQGRTSEIFNCTIPYIWGGADGARVWLTGNSNYNNRDYGSGLEDPTYWPVTQYDNIGKTDDPIKGYSELYGSLVIVKKGSIFVRDYEIDADGNPAFPTKRLNGSTGTEATDSIQILDTFPTFVTKKGVYQVTSIDPTQETNVRHISDDIDKNVNIISIQGLLEMGNLDDYVSIDFDSKYWLFNPNNGKVWVYDYRYIINGMGQWFLLDNLYANCLLEINGNLYMGETRGGLINRFLTSEDNDQYSDIETMTVATSTTPINAYWTSKINNYNVATNLKLVSKVFFDLKPSKRSSAILSVRSDLKSVWSNVKEVFVSLFSYSLLAYSIFTYAGSEFPKQTRTKVKAKKIGYYQIKISNNKASESLGILNVATKILYQREVK
jgi:hypothetical protein